MALPVFPAHRFNPASVASGLVGRVIQSPPSISGLDQAISTDGGGRWKVDYSGIVLRTPEQMRRWEAWVAYLCDGVNECLVPLVSAYTAPRAQIVGVTKPMGVIGDDDPYFPQAVKYRQASVIATVAASAALRATQLDINVAQGSAPQPGMKFSIGERAHIIRSIVSRASATRAVCRIDSPLRSAVASGVAVMFDWPVVRCRLAAGQDLTSVMINGRSEQQVTFLESFA